MIRILGPMVAALLALTSATAEQSIPPLYGVDRGAYIQQLAPNPQIKVIDLSNDRVYDFAFSAGSPGSQIKVRVGAKCGKGHYVSPAGAYGVEGLESPWVSGYFTFSNSSFLPAIDGFLPDPAGEDFPSEMRQTAIDRCNALPKAYVTANSWTIKDAEMGRLLGYVAPCVTKPGVVVEVYRPGPFDSSGTGVSSKIPLKVDIVCTALGPEGDKNQGGDVTGKGDHFEIPFQVHDVDWGVRGTNTYQGRCPVTAAFPVRLKISGAGTLRYRFVHNGTSGPVESLALGGPELKTRTVTFTTGIGQPFKPSSLVAPTGPAKGPQLTAPKGPGGGPNITQAPPNVHQGTVAFEIVAPQAGQASTPAPVHYRVTCEAPKPPEPGLTGGPQSPTPTAPKAATLVALPDIAPGQGITIGGQTMAWDGEIQLTATMAGAVRGGRCEYRYAYDVVNRGTGAAQPAFVNRLRTGGGMLAQDTGVTLTPGQTRRLDGVLRLGPGAHTVTAHLDDDEQVAEISEGNNAPSVRVTVTGQCGTSSLPASGAVRTP
jgi:hypothetical protein